jgi:RNA-directed DNA polymerase
MKEHFLKLKDHNDLASFFGLTYSMLTNIIYKTDPIYKYHQFQIPKKNGGHRQICSPSKKLKAVQTKLKDILYEIYPTKPSVYGFVKKRNIVRNAERHLDKKYIFNIDIIDFFGSIHFGRIRNLFKSSPFNFNHTISTILAQICCFDNSLPQGAPTSPILSNMIAWKLDSQLQKLAKATNSTYTRYADDISFSFTCNKNRLPDRIVVLLNGKWSPGVTLTQIIEKNGFSINYEKVRLCNRFSRMEVTGLTVNEFPNVRRRYVRQLSSMLYAWREYGYDEAEKEYNDKYNSKHRASDKPKSYLHMIKGKLAFLLSVKTDRDDLFNKLATQFNDLAVEDHKFKIVDITDPEKNAIDALWVIETSYNESDGKLIASQGSGFQLKDVGIVTCAHVVSEDNVLYKNLEAYKHSDASKRYKINVVRLCSHQDVAICSIQEVDGKLPQNYTIESSERTVVIQENVKLLGFPGHAPSHSHYIVDSKVAKTYIESGVEKFEIDKLIRAGNSGGPIINSDSKVVGMAQKGITGGAGKNGCLLISEIEKVLSSDEYKI